ncbi:MAG TPA: glycosyltransferase family 2 protein [Pyrinomonadaceae bacterium]|nr:glycosyltransferase family 2 protein [Pyrinomonadaceae bacterium]
MEHEPLFSVIIPTHNRAELILKTLNSVLSQTHQSYEVIVVDDASTDDTEQVLASLIRTQTIRYVRHEQNYERAQSRNTGMKNARGRFVTFLDSDDLMYSTNLEDAANFIKADPTTKLFHNLYQLVDENDRVLCKYDFPSLEDPLRAITGGNFLASIGVFIHREIYENYSFDTNPLLTGSEDWDFWLRVVPHYQPGRINKVNSAVVQHGARSINHMELDRMERRFKYLTGKISDDPKLSSVYANYLKRLEAGSLLYTSTVANLMCRHSDALRLLRRAASLDLGLVGSRSFMKALGIALLRWNKGH